MTFQLDFQEIDNSFDLKFEDTVVTTDGGYDRGYEAGHKDGLVEGEEIGIAKGGKIAVQERVDTIGGLVGLFQGSKMNNDWGCWILDKIDCSKYTDATKMFYNGSWTVFPMFDASNIKNATSMFCMCQTYTQGMPRYDFRNVETFYETFRNCTGALELPDIETPNANNMKGMYSGCGKITTVPNFDTSKVTNMTETFYGCKSVTEIHPYDVSAVTSCNEMLRNCTALKSIPSFNFSKVKNIERFASGCSNLLSVGKINFSNASYVYQLFDNCPKLEIVEDVDIRSATATYNNFQNCTNLTTLKVRNIKASIQVGSGTSYGHLLTLESLIGLCYELRDIGSQRTLTVGSANLAKLADVYVREIAITDAMREADDLIDEKLPFEVCESTDEGATLISDYVLFKNWKLA